MNVILHVTKRRTWEKAKIEGEHYTKSLERGGFIHCSTKPQVIEVADYLFKDQTGLVLLVIDQAKVIPEIKYEGVEETDLFPHIYGPLNLDAVINVVDFPPQADGSFKLPEEVLEIK